MASPWQDVAHDPPSARTRPIIKIFSAFYLPVCIRRFSDTGSRSVLYREEGPGGETSFVPAERTSGVQPGSAGPADVLTTQRRCEQI